MYTFYLYFWGELETTVVRSFHKPYTYKPYKKTSKYRFRGHCSNPNNLSFVIYQTLKRVCYYFALKVSSAINGSRKPTAKDCDVRRNNNNVNTEKISKARTFLVRVEMHIICLK